MGRMCAPKLTRICKNGRRKKDGTLSIPFLGQHVPRVSTGNLFLRTSWGNRRPTHIRVEGFGLRVQDSKP